MADDNVIRREFQAELVPTGDGRTIDMRIIPYNRVARVSDGGPHYDEEWLPGVFDKQINAPNRVFVNVEHEKGFSGVVGRGSEFRSTPDGFEGSVRVLAGELGDRALELVNDGALTGVSVEAVPLKSQRGANGVVQRVKARLTNIALCRNPAFVDAQVLAVREAPEEESEVVVVAPDISRSEQVLSSLGYEPLVFREMVNHPWNGSAERFDDEQYERSCLVCRPGDGSAKERCSLPVLEPDGDLNIQGMHAAAQRLNQTGMSMEMKAQAARKLVRYYRQAGETPPPALLSFANR